MPGRSLRRPTGRRPWRKAIGLTAIAAMAASACAKAPQTTLSPKGPAARDIANLINPVFLVAGVVFLLVEGGIVFLILKYRRGRSDDDAIPAQVHGYFWLEIGWTVVPAAILLFVTAGTLITLFRLADQPKGALSVDVYGQQWWWAFEYDTNGDSKPDIITANELVIPAGRPVVLHITSRDVIHSFWIPALNGKADAVPSRDHLLTIEADNPGTYLGQCTEYCGLSHSNMRARAVALSTDDFDTWMRGQEQEAATPSGTEATAGLALFKQLCATCHQVNGVNQREGAAALLSQHAPNLTHLMSRSTFAGGVFTLKNTDGSLNRPALEAWLRDPPGELPMAPAGRRGMPNLGLTEPQIDQLVAYLETLK